MPFEHKIPHQPWDPNRPRTIIYSVDEIPDFANECEEHEFWSTHEFSDELMGQAMWDPDDPLAPGSSNALPDDVEQALERARQARRAH
jgi:hypothetical protein